MANDITPEQLERFAREAEDNQDTSTRYGPPLVAAASTIRDLAARLAEAEKRAVPTGYYHRTVYERSFEPEGRRVWVYYPDGPGKLWRAYTKRGGHGEGETAEEAIRAAEEADHAD